MPAIKEKRSPSPAEEAPILTWVSIAKVKDGWVALTAQTQGNLVISKTVHSTPAPKNLAVQSFKILTATKIISPELGNILNLDEEPV